MKKKETKGSAHKITARTNANPILSDMYDVEAIRRKRLHKGKLQYLIKWEGWPESTNTWEPIEHLQNVIDLIDEFEMKLKSGNCMKQKYKHEDIVPSVTLTEDPPQPTYPFIDNPPLVLFADPVDPK